ncbi:TIGR04222 domain-containing membrane protein [Streptomyces europaeiscabiei]|uniref:TIGR04222 domain-containing membrane protein n=1 Tax=Streptomyces europaeiscabiei TaxID=146819 RepID=UPI0029A60272|nr:TIGR04222 domain-containing membrane protein [Streptomyces europaeiscabiei]MDX2526817.1 TIGR04222 domain-containing membrane protein [Streptomyces europaeiscabiei]
MIQVVVLSGCVVGYIGVMAAAWWLDGRVYGKAVSAARDRHAATMPEPADLAPGAAVAMGPAAIAVLVGGPWQAFHAVVSGLLATGRLEKSVSHTGSPTLRWKHGPPPEAGVEKAIWDTHRDVAHLHADVVVHPVVRRLVSEGLLHEGEEPRIPFRPPRPVWARSAAVLGLLFTCLVGRLFPNGPYLGKGPVIAAMVVAALSLLMFVNANEPNPQSLRLPPLTERGDQMVRQARARFSHLDPAERTGSQPYEPDEVAFAVALFGDQAVAYLSQDLVEVFGESRRYFTQMILDARRQEYLQRWSG